MMDDLQSKISEAARAGWDWFDDQDPEIKRRLDIRRELASEEARAVARAWADFAATPGGEKALQALHKATLGRTVFFVNLGLDPASMANFGAFREGQNSLAHEIFRKVAEGRGENTEPRDVT